MARWKKLLIFFVLIFVAVKAIHYLYIHVTLHKHAVIALPVATTAASSGVANNKPLSKPVAHENSSTTKAPFTPAAGFGVQSEGQVVWPSAHLMLSGFCAMENSLLLEPLDHYFFIQLWDKIKSYASFQHHASVALPSKKSVVITLPVASKEAVVSAPKQVEHPVVVVRPAPTPREALPVKEELKIAQPKAAAIKASVPGIPSRPINKVSHSDNKKHEAIVLHQKNAPTSSIPLYIEEDAKASIQTVAPRSKSLNTKAPAKKRIHTYTKPASKKCIVPKAKHKTIKNEDWGITSPPVKHRNKRHKPCVVQQPPEPAPTSDQSSTLPPVVTQSMVVTPRSSPSPRSPKKKKWSVSDDGPAPLGSYPYDDWVSE